MPPTTEQLNIRIAASLKKTLKTQALARGETLQDYAEALLLRGTLTEPAAGDPRPSVPAGSVSAENPTGARSPQRAATVGHVAINEQPPSRTAAGDPTLQGGHPERVSVETESLAAHTSVGGEPSSSLGAAARGEEAPIASESPPRPKRPRKLMCEHHVRPGSYCPVCDG